MSTLSTRIKAALEKSQKSQVALAMAVEVSPQAVNSWVNGNAKGLTGGNLIKAASFLGVNANWLATGEGEMVVEASKPLFHEAKKLTIPMVPSINNSTGMSKQILDFQSLEKIDESDLGAFISSAIKLLGSVGDELKQDDKNELVSILKLAVATTDANMQEDLARIFAFHAKNAKFALSARSEFDAIQQLKASLLVSD